MKSPSLPALILVALVTLCPGAMAAADIGAERARFKQTFDALTAGQLQRAAQLVAGLESYPLYVYYRYHELRRRLAPAAAGAVRAFLATYDGSLLAERLRREWLIELGRQQNWPGYLADYRPQKSVQLQCLFLTARIREGTLDGVLDEARKLWLAGGSQPGECDPVFDALKRSPLMTDVLVWERIALAMERGNTGLARRLSQRLGNPAQRDLAGVWLAAHTDPRRALQPAALRGDPATVRTVVRYAIERLAQRDVDAARAAWRTAVSRHAFTPPEQNAVRRALAIAAVRQAHPDRLMLLDDIDPDFVDLTIDAYRLREAISARAWERLLRWADNAPARPAEALRWRYWRARSLDELGRGEEAAAAYAVLAVERDYYGFLAADHIGRPYAMNFARAGADSAQLAAIETRPGIARARELYLLRMRDWARQEWLYETAAMGRADLEAAARIAHEWGWYDQAIATLGRAESYDDLEIRFPVVYLREVDTFAKKRAVERAVLFSIIRTESAFFANARSPSGALGLMQLMPQTGRETGTRIGIRIGAADELLDTERNIAIGSKYWHDMLAHYRGNFAMAAAAYNAGPGRVRAWRPAAACVPADIWIDAIPFDETRIYVQRALFYAAIYEWRLKDPPTPLHKRLLAIPDRARPADASC